RHGIATGGARRVTEGSLGLPGVEGAAVVLFEVRLIIAGNSQAKVTKGLALGIAFAALTEDGRDGILSGFGLRVGKAFQGGVDDTVQILGQRIHRSLQGLGDDGAVGIALNLFAYALLTESFG